MKKIFKNLFLFTLLFSVSVLYGHEPVLEKLDTEFYLNFLNAENTGDFSDWEKTLVSEIDEIPNSEEYAEAFFYVYFYVPFYNLEKSENYFALKNIVDEYSSDYFLLANFFKNKANTSLSKRYNIGTEIREMTFTLDSEIENKISSYIPKEDNIKTFLLDSISEVEAMYRRFSSQAANDETSSLRFSDEAYIQLTKKPNLLYVLQNEPDYSSMYDAYLVTGENLNGISFGETDSYYELLACLEDLDEIAKENGLILSNIFSPALNSVVKLYHTSPFYLTLLNWQQCEDILGELDLIYLYSHYSERISQLLKK